MTRAQEASSEELAAVDLPVVSLHVKSADLDLDFALNVPIKVPESRSLQGLASMVATALSKNMTLDMTQAEQVQRFNANLQRRVELHDERLAFFKRVREQISQTTHTMQNMKRDYYREIDRLREQISRLKGNPAADVEERVQFFDPDFYRLPEWKEIVEQLDAERIKREALRDQAGRVFTRVPVHTLCASCQRKFLDGEDENSCTRSTQTEPEIDSVQTQADSSGTTTVGDDTEQEYVDSEVAVEPACRANVQLRKKLGRELHSLKGVRETAFTTHCKSVAAKMLGRQAASYQKHLCRMSFARLRDHENPSGGDAPVCSEVTAVGSARADTSVKRGNGVISGGVCPSRMVTGRRRASTASSVARTPECGFANSTAKKHLTKYDSDSCDTADEHTEGTITSRCGSVVSHENDKDALTPLEVDACEGRADAVRNLVKMLQRRHDSSNVAECELDSARGDVKSAKVRFRATVVKMLVRRLAGYERCLQRHALACLFGIDVEAPKPSNPEATCLVEVPTFDADSSLMEQPRWRGYDADAPPVAKVATDMRRHRSPSVASSNSVTQCSLLVPPTSREDVRSLAGSRRPGKSSRLLSPLSMQRKLSKDMLHVPSQLASPRRTDRDSWTQSLKNSPSRESTPPTSRSATPVDEVVADVRRRASSSSRRRRHSTPSVPIRISRVDVGLGSLALPLSAVQSRPSVHPLPTIPRSPTPSAKRQES
eukprot:TRINITY_DN62034_c0_g1_i1.p1 TRINITY_DN62034_c0_g1~~TRINITY_DN62034_c0_g1_i1.p1  ORF type:complete len:738 (-),score=101.37 TRINITY_DN62034_c0_g1_i1:174-2318(-)